MVRPGEEDLMRIANVVGEGELGAGGYDIPPHLVSTGVTVDTFEMRLPWLAQNSVELALTQVASVEAVMRAEAAGYDAIFINSAADYGLRAARAAVRVPVFGAGQISMLVACSLGDRFSVV